MTNHYAQAADGIIKSVERKYGKGWRNALSAAAQEDILTAHAFMATYRHGASEDMQHAMAMVRAVLATEGGAA